MSKLRHMTELELLGKQVDAGKVMDDILDQRDNGIRNNIPEFEEAKGHYEAIERELKRRNA